MFSLSPDEGLELLLEGIKEQSKDELYQLWLKRYVTTIEKKEDFVEWNKFMDKHLKQNKTLPTSDKTDEEVIDHAESILEMMKRSRS